MDDDTKKVEAKARAQETFDRFFEEWWKLPPLVRASAAAHLAHHMLDMTDRLGRDLLRNRKDMPRRSKVDQLFLGSYIVIRDMAVALANQADDEADSENETRDVRYESDRDFMMEFMLHRRLSWVEENRYTFSDEIEKSVVANAKARIEREVADNIMKQTEGDIDKEVLDDLKKDVE